MPTFLELCAACDKWDPVAAVRDRSVFPFYVAGCHVGYVPDFVLPKLLEIIEAPDDKETGFSLIYAIPDDESQQPYLEAVEFDPENTLGFLRRTELMDTLLRHWRATDAFGTLKGWREERYAIYGELGSTYHDGLTWDGVAKNKDNTRPLPKNTIMTIERSGAELFGIRTFGAHLTGYVRTETEGLKLWVAKRSPTKQTYPDMLDNTVAGGIPVDQTPTEAIVRECAEEAGIPEEVAKAVGFGRRRGHFSPCCSPHSGL